MMMSAMGGATVVMMGDGNGEWEMLAHHRAGWARRPAIGRWSRDVAAVPGVGPAGGEEGMGRANGRRGNGDDEDDDNA